MRGDRRSIKRKSLSRENASDAGTRAFYRPLQTGDWSLTSSTCKWVRQQLAVYRPEDWDSSDLPRIKAHLATCPGCRHVQEDFRQTGAAIRHLPTLTPPPEFRAAVMAAIREEARNQAPTLAEIS